MPFIKKRKLSTKSIFLQTKLKYREAKYSRHLQKLCVADKNTRTHPELQYGYTWCCQVL